jgi:hypothetical protein
MQFNERKAQTLEFFSRRQWTRPGVYAAECAFYPHKAAWTYLLRLRKWGLLNRGHDVTGRVVYKLAPRGARWLQRRRQREGV